MFVVTTRECILNQAKLHYEKPPERTSITVPALSTFQSIRGESRQLQLAPSLCQIVVGLKDYLHGRVGLPCSEGTKKLVSSAGGAGCFVAGYSAAALRGALLLGFSAGSEASHASASRTLPKTRSCNPSRAATFSAVRFTPA